MHFGSILSAVHVFSRLSLFGLNGKYNSVTQRLTIQFLVLVAVWVGLSVTAQRLPSAPEANLLEIRSVSAQDKPLSWHPGRPLILRALTKNITFVFGPEPNATRQPVRLRYKLEGFDSAWRDGEGDMLVGLRFCDASGERIGQKCFNVHGESTGWNGSLETSALTHRRETAVVPPRAAQLEMIISSAGPPETVGIYAVDNLVVEKLTTANKSPEVLLRSPFDRNLQENGVNGDPPGWIRDGIRPSMAKIVALGEAPKAQAFAIVDDDPTGHAEWRTRQEAWPQIAPGDNLVLEWNEMYSMGRGGVVQEAHYERIPPGDYRFRAAEFTTFGAPTGLEATLAIRVPRPLWEAPWFWALFAGVSVAAAAGILRYSALQRVRRTLSRLRQQQTLEQERLRIAQDIHDDLGARVTQISLVSALAQADPSFSEKARAEFDRISRMSREMVSALYETVWAVNPENDNLDAVGNYLCQRINEFCTQAQLRCRLHVGELPRDIEISSQTRHNISMAVQEAVHNVIKHAHASQITAHVTFSDMVLTVSV